MNITQQIAYKVELDKAQMAVITKALTGALKEREREEAFQLGMMLLENVNACSRSRLEITEGALLRASSVQR